MRLLNRNIEFKACHRKPERSFHWFGKQFPLCARCTGLHLGYLSFPIFLFGFVKFGWMWTLLLILPTVIDGITQAFLNRESNNYLRFITGIFAGVGMMSLIAVIGQAIGEFILLNMN